MATTTRLFRWGAHYRLGVTEIDQQHEALSVVLNQLYDAFQHGATRAVVSARLRALIEEVRRHFKDEERLMKERRYPGFVGHCSEHAFLANHVSEIQREFDAGAGELSESIMHYLKDWLRDHILLSDKRMGEFMVTGGR